MCASPDARSRKRLIMFYDVFIYFCSTFFNDDDQNALYSCAYTTHTYVVAFRYFYTRISFMRTERSRGELQYYLLLRTHNITAVSFVVVDSVVCIRDALTRRDENLISYWSFGEF